MSLSSSVNLGLFLTLFWFIVHVQLLTLYCFKSYFVLIVLWLKYSCISIQLGAKTVSVFYKEKRMVVKRSYVLSICCMKDILVPFRLNKVVVTARKYKHFKSLGSSSTSLKKTKPKTPPPPPAPYKKSAISVLYLQKKKSIWNCFP